MKKTILLALRCCALLCFIFSFTSYAQKYKASASNQNSAKSNKTQKLADIYVAGACYNAATKRYTAVYWKNGEPVALTDGQRDAEATSMAVVGDDIYVLIHIDGQAVYWKNGQETRFRHDKGDYNVAYSIAVINGDVYVVGYYRDYNDTQTVFKDFAMYWKNGQPAKLPVPTEDGQGLAYKVAAVDDDIYIIGRHGNNPLYWKNGQLLETINELKEVSAIAQLQGNTYALGKTQSGLPAYWKNGHTESLSNGNGIAMCMAVSGSDVYVAGVDDSNGNGYKDDGDVARCWKNGQLLADLKGTDYSIYRPTSIAVSSNDVYIVGEARIGSSSYGEKILKNGQKMKLSPIEGYQGSTVHFVTSNERSEGMKPKQSAVNVKKESRVESEVNVQPEKTLAPNTEKALSAQEEADLFFEENRKKPGVMTTASGLQYEILKQGTGPRVLVSDKIQVIHKKTLMFGREIKDQGKYSSPITYEVRNLMQGLIEAITLMNMGSNYRLYIPAKLISAEAVKRGATIIFETEILGILN